jgi:polo-like kinase 1
MHLQLKSSQALLKLLDRTAEESYKQEDSSVPTGIDPSMSKNLVYVKKWIWTKHAILFRLSNQTIQVVFYHQTEVLLTPGERYITYVDKDHNQQPYNFTDELVGSFAKLENVSNTSGISWVSSSRASDDELF